MFNLKQFYLSLSKDEREAFCAAIDLTPKYVERHVIRRTRKPSLETLLKLHEATGVEVKDLIGWWA